MIWQPIRNGIRLETWSFRLKFGRKTISRGGFPTRKHAATALRLAREAAADDDLRTLEAMRKRRSQTVGQLLEDYRAAGCPNKTGHIRRETARTVEERNITTLLSWWAGKPAAQISEQDRLDYWAFRQGNHRAGYGRSGHRTTELELGTLNNAIHWSWRRGDLRELPRSMRCTFREDSDIAHARDHMPASGDELHAIARALFAEKPVYGWAYLLGAFTGLRRIELLSLEASPQRDGLQFPPGFTDATYLRIQRAKRGRNPRVALNDPNRPHIRPLIDLIRQWHAANTNPDPRLLPVDPDKLSKAVVAVAAALKLPRRTLHATRAYYASVRLAQGASADAVAQELGQRSGDDLVRDVYGADPDDFDSADWTSLNTRLTWLPNTPGVEPAWTWWTKRPTNIIAL